MIFQFDQITLDTTQFRLSKSGHPVAVEPQVFDVLVYLVEHRERLVTRDELLENLWKGKVVSDSALGARIKDARKAIGDSGDKQAVIKTVFGRGYQFIAPVSEHDGSGAFSKPETHYAQNGDVGIAYQVFGEGPDDLIIIPGWLSNLDLFWEQPRAVRFFLELETFCRVILIDRRGTGLSDRVTPPTLDVQMKDVLAVMAATGSKHAAMLGYSEGGSICAQFAFSHPRRTSALILIGTAARWVCDDDYPFGPSIEEAEQWITEVENNWGGPVAVDVTAPSLVDDVEYCEWLARFFRSSASKGAAIALLRMGMEIDLCPILASIETPTLVLQAKGDLTCPLEAGRHMARSIPGARIVELDTNDHFPFVGCPNEIVSEVRSFLRGLRD